MQPGLLNAFFDRDSVAMGDDAEGHQCLLVFTRDAPLSVFLGAPIHQVLASISGGHATWVIQLHELLVAPSPPDAGRVRVTDVAVVAEQRTAPRLLVPDAPVSQVGTGTLFAVYLAQQDPDEVYTALSRRGDGDAQLQPHLPKRASDRQFGALRAFPNPRVQKTYTQYPNNPEEIPAEQRVMLRLPAAEPHAGVGRET
ncbi:hypothetical protein [Deinococcus sonorensis]|uniref:Uncharacterized protein n=2 Tax=Deinococcus sonorensis TaxID=309891 RepID=A0AAU7U7B4_9DEIO